MDFTDIQRIKESSFEGFITIHTLMKTSCTATPKTRGVYLVLYTGVNMPEFLAISVGGHFKGKNPTVPVEELYSRWVDRAIVINIGKAGGDSSGATLQSRLRQYMKFGQGEPIGHWGGRLIWQLKNNRDLIVCWKPTPNEEPRKVEKTLIQQFKIVYKRRPFANLSD